nr:MAG TPA: hypothetical protein [Caudoviricetes sp.]
MHCFKKFLLNLHIFYNKRCLYIIRKSNFPRNPKRSV